MNNRPLLPTGCMTAGCLGCIIIVFSILILITVVRFSPSSTEDSLKSYYSNPEKETIEFPQKEIVIPPLEEKLILKLQVDKGSERWYVGRRGNRYIGQFIQYMPSSPLYVHTKGNIFALGEQLRQGGIHPSDVTILE